MKALYCLVALPFLAALSCERHDWEETKVLHETHGHDDHGHGDGEHGAEGGDEAGGHH